MWIPQQLGGRITGYSRIWGPAVPGVTLATRKLAHRFSGYPWSASVYLSPASTAQSTVQAEDGTKNDLLEKRVARGGVVVL